MLLGPKSKRAQKDPKQNPFKTINPAELRIKKDRNDLDPPSNIKVEFKNEEDLTKFQIILEPTNDSLWFKGKYTFDVDVPNEYPHEPPKLQCQNPIFHPNIDEQGKVCLNILRADWKPVFNINTITIGLNSLFTDPNPNDPLNKEAGELMKDNAKEFKHGATAGSTTPTARIITADGKVGASLLHIYLLIACA